ncbi:50S ribosomal protein L29 [Candidatus Fermentibacterales bacterium]|nr:50S ribosomal protein L29 [Candidatus Fermentibacterales bacterium]
MRVNEMRSMSRGELLDRVRELRQELFNLRFRVITEQLDNPLRLRAARRELAAALTMLREDELGLSPLAGSTEEKSKG